jgi:hypothetical protein
MRRGTPHRLRTHSLSVGAGRAHMTPDGLVLTVPADRSWHCAECRDVHVLVLPGATRQTLLDFARMLEHLAKHVVPTTPDGAVIQ